MMLRILMINQKKFTNIKIEEGAENKNSILKSYDFFLNHKYDQIQDRQKPYSGHFLYANIFHYISH